MNTINIEKTREEIWMVAKTISGADCGDEATAVALLLASAIVGPEIRRAASLIGIPYRGIMWMGTNARLNEIWVADRVCMNGDWFDEEYGAVALLCDSMCVLGVLERTAT